MLIPKTVTVSGSFKAYGYRDGLSSGTDLSMTFEVPEGMTMDEVKAEIVKTKFTLDVTALRIEAGKGMIPAELMQDIVQRSKKNSKDMIEAYGKQEPTE